MDDKSTERMRESEARLQAAVDLVKIGCYSWNPQTNELQWDSTVKAMWGLPPDAVVDYNVWRAQLHPDDLARVEAAIERCADPRGDGLYDIEYRVIGKIDGVERWIATRGRTNFEKDKPVSFYGVAIEITDRKRIENALERRVEERTRELAATNEKLRLEIAERKRAIEELAKRAQQQAAIAELSQGALTVSNHHWLLNEAVNAIAKTLGVEICSALELLPGGDAFLVKAGVGWLPGLVGSLKIPAGANSPAGYALLRNEPVVFGDLEHETRFEAPPELSKHGILSGAVVMIAGRDRPFGALHALSKSRRVFTQDDLHFLQSVANIAATTIQRQAFEKDILEISEREQRRIGQDLHDDLCQRLAGIALACDLLQQSLAKTSKDESAGVAKIARELREAIAHTRMLARGLSPAPLGANGLMSGFEHLASSVTELFHVSCQFESEPPVLIENDSATTHLYRIAQEAITNAITHGKSKNIVLRLSGRGGKTSLSIEDDGIGFPDSPEPGTGMGLRIMKYRAEMIGAILDVRRKGQNGTIVTCEAKRSP